LRDLINLRLYNGALRPVGSDTLVQSAGVAQSASGVNYVHQTTSGKKYLFSHVSGGKITYVEIPSNDTPVEITAAGDITASLRFSSIGNLVVVFNETAEVMYYCLYEIDTDSYRWIGEERFPEMLDVEITAIPTTLTASPDPPDLTSVADGYLSADVADEDRLATLEGLFKLQETQRNIDNGFTGLASIIYAYEMFDGTIIKHSHPTYLKVGEWRYYSRTDPEDAEGVYLVYQDIQIDINTIQNDIDSINTTYGSLIKGLNIYMSRPLNPYKVDVAPLTLVTNNEEVEYINDLDILKSQLIENASYRLIKKYKIDSLETGILTSKLEIGNVSDIETLAAMPIDNFTHHKIYPQNDFIYNSRLFLGDLKTYLYKGYSPAMFVTDQGLTHASLGDYDIYFEVTLKDIDGTRTVLSDEVNFEWSVEAENTPYFTMKEFFSYPDSRATSLTIWLKIGSNNHNMGEYALTAHPTLNMSYLIWDGTIFTFDFGAADTAPTESNIILDRNRIQASYVNNPLYFPAENSYNVGSGIIKGMGTNSLNIETGQFGEYPLYAFASDGIWAMSISRDPSILIDSVKPASREVCINSKAILPVPGGVVFITGRGVMIISGMDPVRLDQEFENDFASPLSGNLDYDDITADGQVADVSDFLETVSYQTFLATAVIGYNYIKEEVFVSNPAYDYSYVFSFASKSWFKLGRKYTGFCNYYPSQLGIRAISETYRLYDITQESLYDLYVPSLIETYPIKMNTDTFTKVTHAVCRGMLKSDDSKGAGFSVFGSIDGITWYQMNESNDSGNIKDIWLGRSPYSVMQYIFLFTGSLGDGSFLTHLDIAFDDSFASRLR
jgi:hypothetical protein